MMLISPVNRKNTEAHSAASPVSLMYETVFDVFELRKENYLELGHWLDIVPAKSCLKSLETV